MSKSRLRIETQSFDHLTNRQVEIVRLLAVGLTTREIAAMLFLSAKTVDTHKANIFKRLGAHRLVDLVWIAIKSGIVKIEDWERAKNPVHGVTPQLIWDDPTDDRNRT